VEIFGCVLWLMMIRVVLARRVVFVYADFPVLFMLHCI